nr:MAG TPA_asm: hypothetical protein [Caudoviricetes sp.]
MKRKVHNFGLECSRRIVTYISRIELLYKAFRVIYVHTKRNTESRRKPP